VLTLRELRVPAAEWVRRVVAPNAPGIMAQLAVSVPFAVWGLPRAGDLTTALVAGGAGIAVSFASFLLLGLERRERDHLVATVRVALGLRRAAPARP
jgi:hypothetical protein